MPSTHRQRDALIALGSNLGDRAGVLDAACEAIAALPATSLIRKSGWLATPPVGGPAGQGDFLNGALRVTTEFSAAGLIAELNQIEAAAGRERRVRWAARPLDLDLLLLGDLVDANESLKVPHPRMTFRPFVMGPAVEVAANMQHPVLGATLRELLEQLQHGNDQIFVCGEEKLSAHIVQLLPANHRARTTLDRNRTQRPKLQIVVGESENKLIAPSLFLDPEMQDRWSQEIEAAVECVWPESRDG